MCCKRFSMQSRSDGNAHPSVRADRPSRRAFTLVELMVVIVIIGLLAGAVTVGVRSYLISGKQSVAKMEIAKICQAIDTYYSLMNKYPENNEGLEVLATPSDKFVDGLLNKVPLDPWGHAYEYHQPGKTGPYEVVCYGADGREGGEGPDQDLSSADLDDET